MDTSERLIESAQELLWERGYIGTSPKAIQERAGAGQGSMYHHFTGKPDLAIAALHRSAEELRMGTQTQLDHPGTALERITAYLLREREVLRGCPIGRMAQDPDVIANPELRRPVQETFDWVRVRLAQVIAEGQMQGEFALSLNAADTASALVAILQGGFVLARAADSVEPYHQAVRGAVALLAAQTT